MHLRSIAVMCGFALSSAAAQTTPPSWRIVADGPAPAGAPADTTKWFVSMAPGWHITVGSGALLFDPRYFAEGRFDAEFEFFIFPDASNEEIGVFLGGTNLDKPAKAYTAFVVRRDGSAAVLRREGARETALQPWAPSAAIVKPEAGGKNVMRVSMDSAGVHLLLNGTRVGTWPRSQLALDGAYGLRVGKQVNLHATRLDVTNRLAPIPRGK